MLFKYPELVKTLGIEPFSAPAVRARLLLMDSTRWHQCLKGKCIYRQVNKETKTLNTGPIREAHYEEI